MLLITSVFYVLFVFILGIFNSAFKAGKKYCKGRKFVSVIVFA